LAYNYANECYKEGYNVNKKALSVIGIKYFLGAKKLRGSFFDKIRYCRSIFSKLKIII